MVYPENPIIRNTERTGWPDGHEPDRPVCPICGEECDRLRQGCPVLDDPDCDECCEA